MSIEQILRDTAKIARERDGLKAIPEGMEKAADLITDLAKKLAYSEQENEVLHERVRQLEISLSSEREACAKVAEDHAKKMELEIKRDGPNDFVEGSMDAGAYIADIIRRRGER